MMNQRQRSLARVWGMNIAVIIVLVAPAVLMAVGLWDDVPNGLRITVAVALSLFVTYELFICAIIWRHGRDIAPPGADYVVVLGAQVRDGRPSRTLADRLDGALAYLAENPRSRCIVCGGQGRDETVSEALVCHDYLVVRGIDSRRILLDDQSRSTVENLRNALEFIDPAHDSICIVTSNYHLARALAIARKMGIANVSGIAVAGVKRYLPINVLRESFAWAKAKFSRNV